MEYGPIVLSLVWLILCAWRIWADHTISWLAEKVFFRHHRIQLAPKPGMLILTSVADRTLDFNSKDENLGVLLRCRAPDSRGTFSPPSRVS